jgi:hypothetical protein
MDCLLGSYEYTTAIPTKAERFASGSPTKVISRLLSVDEQYVI